MMLSEVTPDALTSLLGESGKPEPFATLMLADCVLSSIFCCKVEFAENITGGHPTVSGVLK